MLTPLLNLEKRARPSPRPMPWHRGRRHRLNVRDVGDLDARGKKTRARPGRGVERRSSRRRGRRARRASACLSSERVRRPRRRLDLPRPGLARLLLLKQRFENLGQPRLVGIADDDVDARQRGDGGGIGLRPAAGDDDARAGMTAERAANHLAVGDVGARGDRARVDDDDVGALFERDGLKPALREPRRELEGIDLVEPAAQRRECDRAHAGTSSRSCPQAAPMSSPLLQRTVVVTPAFIRIF